jgi:hypothetical protein
LNAGGAGEGARHKAAPKARAKNAETGHLGNVIRPVLGGSSRSTALCVAGAAIATRCIGRLCRLALAGPHACRQNVNDRRAT